MKRLVSDCYIRILLVLVLLGGMVIQSRLLADDLPPAKDRPLDKIVGFRQPTDDKFFAEAKKINAQTERLMMLGNLKSPTNNEALPPKINYEEQHLVSPVKDQGFCGCCWAFASTEAFESDWMKARQQTGIVMSPKCVLDCVPNDSCDGGTFVEAMNLMRFKGIASDKSYPYDPFTLNKDICRLRLPQGNPQHVDPEYQSFSYRYVDKDNTIPKVEALKKALRDYGPLAVAFRATEAFHKYDPNVPGQKEVFDEHDPGACNHAILLIGWDDSKGAWRIRNSWGVNWGDKGDAWVSYRSNSIGYGAAYVIVAPANFTPRKDFLDAKAAFKAAFNE